MFRSRFPLHDLIDQKAPLEKIHECLSDPLLDVNALRERKSPLMVAVLANRLDIVVALLHDSRTIHELSETGWSPLHQAITRESVSCVWLLLGWNRDVLHLRLDVNELTRLFDIAIGTKNAEILQLLLDYLDSDARQEAVDFSKLYPDVKKKGSDSAAQKRGNPWRNIQDCLSRYIHCNDSIQYCPSDAPSKAQVEQLPYKSRDTTPSQQARMAMRFFNYYKQSRGEKDLFNKAYELASLSAENGDVLGAFMLGTCLADEKKYDEACYYLQTVIFHPSAQKRQAEAAEARLL